MDTVEFAVAKNHEKRDSFTVCGSMKRFTLTDRRWRVRIDKHGRKQIVDSGISRMRAAEDVSGDSGGCKVSIPPIDFKYNWLQVFFDRLKIMKYPPSGDQTVPGSVIDKFFWGNFSRLFLFLFIFVHTIPFALAMVQGVALPRTGLLIPYVKDWVEYAFSFAVLVLVLSAKRFSKLQNDMISEFVEEKVITRDREKIVEKIQSWNRFRENPWFQLVLLVVAEVCTMALLRDLVADGHSSWHSVPASAVGLQNFLGSQEIPTWCAVYVCVIVWPACDYLIFNWIANGIYWVAFTRWLLKELHIDAMHPDRCGGMRIMKYSVLAWSALIITIGILISFNVLTYTPLPGSTTRWDILLEISAFIILAFVIFLGPMCWVTWQLLEAKLQAENLLSDIGRRCALLIRAEMKEIGPLTLEKINAFNMLTGFHSNMVSLSSNVTDMKVWPLDIISIAQMIFSVGGPLSTMLIPDLVQLIRGI